MPSPQRIFGWILNGLTLLIAVLAVGFLIRQYLTRSPVGAPLPQGPSIGSRIEVPGVKWSANGSTLVIAMQVGCHWCEASSGFYRDLIRSNTDGPVHLVAVLPQPIQQDQQFLRSLSLQIQDVRQSELAKLSVYATPTLLLLHGDGRVAKVWTGMLSPEGEAEVFQSLGLARVASASENAAKSVPFSSVSTNSPNSSLISPAQMIRLRERQKMLRIIDVRPLPEFQKGHVAGSLNIPDDELEVRLPHEVPKGAPIVMYCHYCPPCESQKESEAVLTFCAATQWMLQLRGYPEVKILSDDLEHLQAAGVQIIGSSAEEFISGSTPILK
jgi:hypothetical protein